MATFPDGLIIVYLVSVLNRNYYYGLVKDITGSFRGAYLFLSCSLAAAGFLMLTLKKKVPRQ